MNIKIRKGFSIWLIILTFSVTHGYAQVMVTERPGQTIPPATMNKGSFQVEAGFTFEGDKPEDTRLHNITPVSSLFRYGLTDWLELRSGLSFFQKNYTTQGIYHHEFSDIRKGLSPVIFGMKLHILENHGIIPSLSLAGSLSFPQLSTRKYAPDHIAPDLRLSAANHLYQGAGTTYNIGLSWDGFNTLPSFLYSALLWVNHGQKLTSFYELYGFIPPEAVAADVRFDTGLSWLIITNLQADIEGGIGITEFAPDFYVGAGLSWLIVK
ncbi:MAG TPA: transporter [Bacteroidales bacterium]|nr:transporter [Bacteroidales bacterium]